MTRYEVMACRGTSRRTGKPVGSRHRWPQGWGVGSCEFCGRTIHQVRRRQVHR